MFNTYCTLFKAWNPRNIFLSKIHFVSNCFERFPENRGDHSRGRSGGVGGGGFGQGWTVFNNTRGSKCIGIWRGWIWLGYVCCVWFLFFYFSGYTKAETSDHSRYISGELLWKGGDHAIIGEGGIWRNIIVDLCVLWVFLFCFISSVQKRRKRVIFRGNYSETFPWKRGDPLNRAGVGSYLRSWEIKAT